MNTKFFFFVLISFTSLAFAASVGVDTDTTGNAATSLGSLDSCTSVSAGTSIDVDIYAENVTDLLAFNIRVLYNNSVLNLAGKNVDMFLPNPYDASDTVPDSDGDYLISTLTFGSTSSGSGVLARLTFNAIADGEGFVNLTVSLTNSSALDIAVDSTTNGRLVVGQSCEATTTTTLVTTTTQSPSSPSPDSGSPSDSPGGSPSSGGSSPIPSGLPVSPISEIPIATSEVTKTFNNLNPDESNIAHINNAAIGIKQVNIQVYNSVPSVAVSVRATEKPAEIVTPRGWINQYLEIDHPGIDDFNIKEVILDFNVRKDWLSDNGFSADDIVLQRYNEGEWTKLETSLVGENSFEVGYQAISPGLSVFVITADTETATPVVTTTSTTSTTLLVPVENQGPANIFNIFIVISGIVLVIIIYVFFLRKKRL